MNQWSIMVNHPISFSQDVSLSRSGAPKNFTGCKSRAFEVEAIPWENKTQKTSSPPQNPNSSLKNSNCNTSQMTETQFFLLVFPPQKN